MQDYCSVKTPSEGIEPPAQEPESRVLSVKLRGQAFLIIQ